jgi:hypothetical protein
MFRNLDRILRNLFELDTWSLKNLALTCVMLWREKAHAYNVTFTPFRQQLAYQNRAHNLLKRKVDLTRTTTSIEITFQILRNFIRISWERKSLIVHCKLCYTECEKQE